MNIMVKNYKILLFRILFIWFLVNLIQAAFTEVLSDEAYYSLYGKNLAWGYFDHPPMVALLTKVSSLFFKGNLGIRFMTVVLEILTLLFTWRIIEDSHPDKDRIYSFFIISGSICMFAAYGFYTTPDVPLLFFTAFFLYSYKRFLVDQNWKSVLFLSLSMAGLVYSKYQAFLVIGLVILSNIRLLGSYKFWLAGLSAVILFTPHLWWQIENDYPSFKYQLVERSEGLKWHHLIEYLPNQLAVYNPLVLGAVFYIMIKQKPKDLFTRALYFLIAGFIGFFGVTALRGHVEPHWTFPSSIAMIVVLYNYSTKEQKMFRFFRKGLLPIVLILILARILLVMDLPAGQSFGFSGKKAKFRFIETVAKDLPVIFPGSYQDPSLYSFFTGKEGLAVNNLYTRETEFDLWQFEKRYNNKPVFICGFAGKRTQLFDSLGLKFYGYATDSLQTVNRIRIKVAQRSAVLHAGDSLYFSVIFTNPYPYDINFNHRNFPVTICMAFLKGEEVNLFPVVPKDPVIIMRSGEILSKDFATLVPDLPAGGYSFGICLQTSLGPAINDSFSSVRILRR